MSVNPREEIERRFMRFVGALRSHDDELADRLADAVEEAGIGRRAEPGFTVDEWLSVLETCRDDLFLYAAHRNYGGTDDDWAVEWFFRHTGKALVYGADDPGEMYTGTEADRQARAVIENNEMHVGLLDNYPLEMRPVDELYDGDADDK